jgi:hypothetical protein
VCVSQLPIEFLLVFLLVLFETQVDQWNETAFFASAILNMFCAIGDVYTVYVM